ncbi:YybS family protein [Anaeromicrobium sediminis]|uniref:DUF2232 domain-containing protein n=1 Tax=Anaeromicrobium sediminis TaxID=1478221 RepID=A0A267MI48_9FIRM|nr:YybS family protein [Anaeromicrobium sediminis]PAB58473.1 hypothetical protein CCE28_15320 [Anaeromicrobium sediminis]
MNIENKTRGMIEAAMIVTLTSVFAVMGTYIPLLTFILLLIPVPFIILAKRRGLSFTLLGLVVASLIISMVTGPVSAFFTMLTPGVMAIVIGYMLSKNYSPGKILIGGSIGAIVSTTILIQITTSIMGVTITDMMTDMMKQSVDMQLSIYKNLKYDETQIQQISSQWEQISKMGMMMIPSMIIIMSTLFSYINYLVASKILKRVSKEEVSELPPLRYVTLPKNIVMGSFLILALTYISGYFNVVNYNTLVLNVLIIFQVVFSIQGLAIVSFFMHKFKLRKPVRIIIYIFVVFSGSFTVILSTLGFVDAIMNIRRLERS